MQDIKESFESLRNYCEIQNFKGWDSYDGLNSWVIQKTPLGKSRFFRLAWVQLLKRNPINLRPLFSIKKGYNPKGLSLFLIGYCNLYKKEQKKEFLENINFLANKLFEIKTLGYAGDCWGYNFDWQARAFFQPKYTPTVVATSFVAEALLEAYHITKNDSYLKSAISSANFVIYDLNRSYDDQGDFTFSYSPLDKTKVYNAGLLGAKILCLVYQQTKDDNLLDLAGKVVSYACKAQKDDGSWSYGTLPFHQWVDNFHTGFNIECIKRYQDISGDMQFKMHLEKGMDYYLTTFFTADGRSKYYNDQIYPVDIHAPAQLVITLCKYGNICEHKKMVNTVLTWTIHNMQSKKGYFYYQKKTYFTSRIPYIRWAQSWMFYAYSYYFLND